MKYTIDLIEFETISKKIAQIANKIYKSTKYTVENIDIVCCLRNHQDGKGPVCSTIAGLRNPVDNLYDLQVDVIDCPSEALKQLLEGIELMEKENYLDRVEKVIERGRNTKPN